MLGTDGPPDSQARAEPARAGLPGFLNMTPEFGSLATVDENARRRFEAAGREGRPQPIEHFLPDSSHPHYFATLQELVHIELEMIWRAWGKSPGAGSGSARVEAYLA